MRAGTWWQVHLELARQWAEDVRSEPLATAGGSKLQPVELEDKVASKREVRFVQSGHEMAAASSPLCACAGP